MQGEEDAEAGFLGLIDVHLPVLQEAQDPGRGGAGLFLGAGGDHRGAGLDGLEQGFAGGVVIAVVGDLQDVRPGDETGGEEIGFLREFHISAEEHAAGGGFRQQDQGVVILLVFGRAEGPQDPEGAAFQGQFVSGAEPDDFRILLFGRFLGGVVFIILFRQEEGRDVDFGDLDIGFQELFQAAHMVGIHVGDDDPVQAGNSEKGEGLLHRIGIVAAAGINQVDGVSAAKQQAVRFADVNSKEGKGIRGIRGRSVLSVGRDAGKGGQGKNEQNGSH